MILSTESNMLYDKFRIDNDLSTYELDNLPESLTLGGSSMLLDTLKMIIESLYDSNKISSEFCDILKNDVRFIQAALILCGNLGFSTLSEKISNLVEEYILSSKNVISLLHLAHVSSSKQLLEVTTAFITSHFYELTDLNPPNTEAAISNLIGLSLVPISTITSILKAEVLQANSEEHVLECVKAIIALRNSKEVMQLALSAPPLPLKAAENDNDKTKNTSNENLENTKKEDENEAVQKSDENTEEKTVITNPSTAILLLSISLLSALDTQPYSQFNPHPSELLLEVYPIFNYSSVNNVNNLSDYMPESAASSPFANLSQTTMAVPSPITASNFLHLNDESVSTLSAFEAQTIRKLSWVSQSCVPNFNSDKNNSQTPTLIPLPPIPSNWPADTLLAVRMRQLTVTSSNPCGELVIPINSLNLENSTMKPVELHPQLLFYRGSPVGNLSISSCRADIKDLVREWSQLGIRDVDSLKEKSPVDDMAIIAKNILVQTLNPSSGLTLRDYSVQSPSSKSIDKQNHLNTDNSSKQTSPAFALMNHTVGSTTPAQIANIEISKINNSGTIFNSFSRLAAQLGQTLAILDSTLSVNNSKNSFSETQEQSTTSTPLALIHALTTHPVVGLPLKRDRLAPEDEDELLSCVRLASLSRESLIGLLKIKGLNKDRIVDALNEKLAIVESTSPQEGLYLSRPRSMMTNNINNQSVSSPPHFDRDEKLMQTGFNQGMFGETALIADALEVNSHYGVHYDRSPAQQTASNINRQLSKHSALNSSPTNRLSMKSFVMRDVNDAEGLFYWLGTVGGTRLWQNPAGRGNIRVFSSGIGFGSLDTLVGREICMLRTSNSHESFVGVDLGDGKRFILKGYVLRNRDATSHCLMSWQVQGSSDGVNWKTLDERSHCHALRIPCAAAYFDISTSRRGKEGQFITETQRNRVMHTAGTFGEVRPTSPIMLMSDNDAFQMFRLIQIGTNSSGSFNLVLSGWEFYGETVGQW